MFICLFVLKREIEIEDTKPVGKKKRKSNSNETEKRKSVKS